MSFLKVLSGIAKYAGIATQAVHEAEAQVGPGNGATKQEIAVAYALAAAHAGQTVPIETVQQVAAAVELAVSVANMLGAFGTAKIQPIQVPKAPSDETKIAAAVAAAVNGGLTING